MRDRIKSGELSALRDAREGIAEKKKAMSKKESDLDGEVFSTQLEVSPHFEKKKKI